MYTENSYWVIWVFVSVKDWFIGNLMLHLILNVKDMGSYNSKITQFESDLWRSLIQFSSQTKVSNNVRSGCIGLTHGLEYLQRLSLHNLCVRIVPLSDILTLKMFPLMFGLKLTFSSLFIPLVFLSCTAVKRLTISSVPTSTNRLLLDSPEAVSSLG